MFSEIDVKVVGTHEKCFERLNNEESDINLTRTTGKEQHPKEKK